MLQEKGSHKDLHEIGDFLCKLDFFMNSDSLHTTGVKRIECLALTIT